MGPARARDLGLRAEDDGTSARTLNATAGRNASFGRATVRRAITCDDSNLLGNDVIAKEAGGPTLR